MAVSERLQKKYFADKFPDSVPTENYVIVWFQDENKYSIVEIKNIIEKDMKEKDMVTVKGAGSARWTGRALFIGTEAQCQRKLKAYEEILDGEQTDDESAITEIRKNRTKQKQGSQKRKSPQALESDPEETCDDDITSTLERNIQAEANRVKSLLEKRSETPQNESKIKRDGQVTVTENLFKQLFERLDGIQSTLDQILENSLTDTHRRSSFSTPPNKKAKLVGVDDNIALNKTPKSSQSPTMQLTPVQVEDGVEDKEFNVDGINLLTDVTAKPKKPNLYATQLLSILFTDEEIRNGCVEPRDANGKKAILDQEKINLIKRCLSIKYGEKILKNWSETRQSLNQKCLDKKKQHLKKFKQAEDDRA